MSKSKLILILANAIISLNIGIWVGINIDLSNYVKLVNFICLLITSFVPALYILFATRKKSDMSINEALVPSLFVTLGFFIINMIATILLLVVSKEKITATIVVESIILSIYLILLLIVMASTSHVKDVYHNKKRGR